MNAHQLIAYLNSIHVGEMASIREKLIEARQACLELEQDRLADQLSEADAALGRADMKTYRKRIETVIAQLGHIR